jgi:DNA-binding MarR family transcriptional regulator
MTERLDRFKRRELIARRSIYVELTADGRTLIDQAHTDLLATEASLLAGLSPDDRSALAGLLAKLAASLEHHQDSRDKDE